MRPFLLLELRVEMLKLDHVALIAPSLEAGAAYVKETLGIDMPYGGKHPQMGTHNLLLRLGTDVFLEVIAVDPEADPPNRPRWFGLDDRATVQSEWDAGRRLRGWVTRTDDLAGVLTQHADKFGRQERVSRGDRQWLFAVKEDGSLPCGGAAPCLMDWGPRGNPASSMPDHGMSLKSFEVQHPDVPWVEKLYKEIGIIDPPKVVWGKCLRYSAVIETSAGLATIC